MAVMALAQVGADFVHVLLVLRGCSLLAVERFFQLVIETVPAFAEQFCRMHGPARAVAAGQCLGWAVEVAAPADAFGVAGVGGEFLGHGGAASMGAHFRLSHLSGAGLIGVKFGEGASGEH